MSATSTVVREQRKPFGGLAITAIVLSVLLGGLVVFSGFWTDIQWFTQLKAVRVFWIQWGWAIALGAIGTLAVTLSAAINFNVTRTSSGGLADYRKYADAHPWLARLVAPLVVGLIFGATLSQQWRTYVLWLHRTPFGSSDAEFGKDVSFYVFTLPVLQSILSLLVTMLAVGGVVTVLGHYVYGGIHMKEGRINLSRKARIHFGVLGAFAAIIMGAYLWLSRYGVLLQDNERFSGANFTAVRAGIPGREILAIASFLVAVLFVIAALKGVWRLVSIGIAVSVVAGLILGSAYPYLVQRFQVQPNAVEMESEYIQRNINATLEAYGLDNVETSQYSAETEAGAGQLRSDAETTAQIRVLDPNVVSPTFTQLQRNRTYYSFADQLSVDRYTINGKARDTVIAVRELNLEGLNNDQRTWVNDHTVYTHGYGVVAAYGNTTTEDGTPHFFQQGIPSTGELGEYEPRVYFGLKSPDYSVVGSPEGTNPWELDYTTDGEKSGQVSTTFAGNGGPSIGSVFSKLMFAIKFRDTDLFFSDRVTSASQILYDRDPRDRVAKIAPYLTLDSRVYPAVVDMDGDPSTPKRLVWIIDGYTTTNEYPYSARQSLKEATDTSESSSVDSFGSERPEQVNYIRNSVKAVVDAYDGSVSLYQWDKKDPIVNAWKAVFPGMLRDVSEMSGDLMSHMRYPEDLFKVQRTLLARYHVKDAAEFYSGSDFWDIPQEPTASSGSRLKQPPYYLTLQMPGQESAEFSISSSYILSGGQNVMTGFVAVDSEAGSEPGKVREGYGKIRMLELPRDVTYPGPGQAENNFLTESTVSTTLNLLKQGGTTVTMGNLLTLPVGGGLLYVQPVYVRTSASGGGTSYPISQYVLTTFGSGSKIGFAPTLEESLNKIFSGDSGATAGDADVSGDKDATISNGNGTVSNGSGGAEATPSPSAGTEATPSGDARERLDTALKDAQSALTESNTAMKNGDWAAYGEAQKKLQRALEQAVAAREEANKAG